jgi:tricorn protease
MRRVFQLFLIALIFVSLAAVSEAKPILAQKPALSRTHVVFVYAGDLWKVPREGGQAQRLTSAPGAETNPVFSPDGSTIAFTGEYDGNVDVFVVPAEGGEPRRLTWHPSPDTALGWTPDGREVLFTSGRTAYSRFSELFTIVEGSFKKLPLPMGYEGSFSADGKHIAYVPLRRAFNVWKRYRGGTATPIWIADLSDSKIEKIPRTDSNDFEPMWVGDKVYFLSDREGPVTLFAYDVRTKEVSRALPNDGLDFKSASAGPGAIVYEQFGSLNLYDLATGKANPLSVSITGDMLEVRDKFVNVGDSLSSSSLSPNAARAAFEARGEIITVPEEKGDARNLTNTPGVMERYPSWSPDGQKIAYFSDESGEYQLHVRDQKGTAEAVRIELEKNPSFYFSPQWSPDNKKIAYEDCHLNLWYVDLEKKTPVRVDKDRVLAGRGNLEPCWSPDSKWLAYIKRLPNYLGAVFVHSLETGKGAQVTDGLSDAGHPVFDPGGKYLYFTASTDSGASLQPDIHSIFRDVTSTVYLAVLDKAEPTPFVPQSDEEKPEDKSRKPAEESEKKEEEKKPEKKDVVVKIDLEGILQRILAVPVPARNYVDLQTGESGTLLAVAAEAPLPGSPFPQGYAVHRFDLKERRADVVVGGVDFFEMARSGKKYLYSQKGSWRIGTLKPMAPAGAPPPPSPAGGAADKTLPTKSIEIRVKPLEEWRQMYREVWRIEREFFYDPNLHGLNLDWVQKKYAPYVEAVASRMDLNYLLAEMLGEMTVGHLGVGGGDTPRPNRVATGLLGADYAIENGRYRFARVYSEKTGTPVPGP